MNALLDVLNATETEWKHGDDLCDCTFQRIGKWENPYIGATYQVRLCCAWARLQEVWPDLFRETQGEQQAWNGEDDMPRALWHRQIALATGKSLPETRQMLSESVPPQGQPRPRPKVRKKRAWWQF